MRQRAVWSLVAVNFTVIACADRRNAEFDKPIPVVIPHPGYLNDCVPSLALRVGEQRRVDFECADNLNENQFWWKESNELTIVIRG